MIQRKVLFWSIVTALGGFLFGFDTAVISGAERSIQHLWQLSAFEHGFTISIALIGTVLGAMFGGIPSDQLGRRQTLALDCGAVLGVGRRRGASAELGTFMVFRFLGGLGVGLPP
nr:MFS transporter [Hymenobacter sp. AT01-02]